MHTDAGPISLERPQRRAVLAVLVLNANQVVSVDRLIEAVWGGAPPATARAQLHALIAAVRRTLREAGAGDAIATRAGGYVLTVQDGQSDLREFETLVQQARTCAVPADAARLLRNALDQWTGTALDGISAEFVEPARARLAEGRLSAQEHLIDIELSLGRHHDLVAELTALTSAHPLRERLVGQLMVALYRSGRQSEALQAGRALRRRLADEEGLDPGPELAHLETAILRADPALTGPAASTLPVAPAGPAPAGRVALRLPPPVDLVGREEELAALDALADSDRAAPVAAALIGPPATGKTAVAVYWAQTRTDRFPDGQVLVDGTQGAAGAAAEVLRAFGVAPDDLPIDDRNLVTACRETLGARRALVIVDDATGAGTVRALLPTRGSSMILATTTGGVDEAALVPVGPLGTDAAVRLLSRTAGEERAGTAGRTLVLRYAGEPLAVLLAGAALADRPGRTVDQQMELGSVDGAQDPVAAAYAAAVADLDPDERRLIRLIARTPGRDVGVRTVAALAEVPAEAGREVLNRLTRLHLVTETADGRFALPGRIRSLAADGTPADDERAAQDRVIAAFLVAADHAARLLYPHLTRLPVPGGDATENPFETPADALRWFDAERVNLVATIEYAAAHGPRAAAWLLADTLRGYFSLTMRVTDWRRSAQAALTAARTEGSDEAHSSAHLSLAELHLRSSRHPADLRDAWQAIAANGRPPWPGPMATGAPAGPPRRPRTTRVLLSLLGVLTLCAAAAGPDRQADAATQTGPGSVVYTYAVATLRQHEAVDFDAGGRRGKGVDPGMDLQPWGSGNHLSAKSKAKLAWVAPGLPATYDVCRRIPAGLRIDVLHGLHAVPDGRRFCVYTAPGRVALATLTRAPRMQHQDLIFNYVVWRGTAPESAPVIPVPPGTELARIAVTVADRDALDIDGTGAIVPQDAPGADLSPYFRGDVLRVKASAVIGLLPEGSPATYQACANLPAPARRLNVSGVRTLLPGRRMCLFSHPGRVALLTVVHPPSDDDPLVRLNVIIWQDSVADGPPGQEPAPWDRDQYPNGDATEKRAEAADSLTPAR